MFECMSFHMLNEIDNEEQMSNDIANVSNDEIHVQCNNNVSSQKTQTCSILWILFDDYDLVILLSLKSEFLNYSKISIDFLR